MSFRNDESTSLAVRAPQSSEDRRAQRARRQRTLRRALAAALGIFLVAGGAYSVTSWLVGLNAGSSGEGQSATVQNLTITAVAVPAATNQLYPGGTGDVVLTISNPNAYPVTLTGVDLPVSTLYAVGARATRNRRFSFGRRRSNFSIEADR